MKTRIIITIVLLVASTTISYSQYLTYKPGGKIFDSENRKLSPKEVKELLANHSDLLDLYNKGRTKKIVGNVFMVSGVLLMGGDLLRGLMADVEYPGILTYAGGGCIVISIPIKTGFSKKIEKVVVDYNNQLSENNENVIKNIALISNANGIGFRVTL